MLFTENSGIFISFLLFFDEVKDNIHKHFIVKKKQNSLIFFIEVLILNKLLLYKTYTCAS